MIEQIRRIGDALVGFVPQVVGALVFLVVGWLACIAVSGVVRRLLARARFDERLSGLVGRGVDHGQRPP